MRTTNKFNIVKDYIGGLFLICALFVFVSGCATSKASYQRSNLTFGMVKKNLVKGQTTQAEIINLFGAPNIMTKNKSGEEVWTYDKISVSASEAAGSIGGGIGGVGTSVIGGGVAGLGGSTSSTSSRSMTLSITFDDKDIVKDYAVMMQEF